MGFWKPLNKGYPETRQQHCPVHKTTNEVKQLPTSLQPKVKAALHEIWMAPTRKATHQALDRTVQRFRANCEKAMETDIQINRDRSRWSKSMSDPVEQHCKNAQKQNQLWNR